MLLKCLYLNCRSAAKPRALDSLKLYCITHNIHLVFMVETWFTTSVTDAELSFNGKFNVFRRDRQSRGGGVCLLARRSLTVVDRTTTNSCESVAIDVMSGSDRIRLTCSYVSNSGNALQRLDRISTTCDWLDQNCDTDAPILALGDFNLPGIDWSVRQSDESVSLENTLVNCAFRNNLSQLVKEPTHLSGSILDLIFVSDTDIVSHLQHLPMLFPSDHTPLQFMLGPISAPVGNPVRGLDFNRMPQPIIAEKLDIIQWRSLFATCTNVDQMYQRFVNACTSIINSHVPLWKEPDDVVRLRRHIKGLEASLRASAEGHQSTSNKLSKAARRLRIMEESRLNIRDARALYRYANRRLKDSQGIPAFKHNDCIVTQDVDKAELLGRHFSSMFENSTSDRLLQGPVSRRRLDVTDTELAFEEFDIYNELISLKPKKSLTADRIPPIFLRTFALFLCEPIFLILERSYREGSVPELFKQGVVSPVFKKGQRSDYGNYRPVTQGSLVCSVLEKLLVRHITNHVTINRLFDPNQHGFVAHRSTCTQLLHMVQDWATFRNFREPFHCIYFDQKSAFDRVPHALLIRKLRQLGIHPLSVNWIRGLLRDRSFVVKVNNSYSAPKAAPSGVPQGSCISPLLYVLFVLDVQDFIPDRVSYLSFADDLKIFCPVSSAASHLLLQTAIDGVMAWCSANGMLLSPNKCLALKSNIDNFDYFIGSSRLPVKSYTRDLGVIMSAQLDFGQHVIETSRSAGVLVNSIFRVFVSRSPAFYVELFKSLVVSRLLYCSPVWRPHLKKHLIMLEMVRKRFLRRLSWRCNTTSSPFIKSIPELFDEQDLRMFNLLQREGLIDHFISVRPNSLRSGISYSPRSTARDDTVHNQFSWRLCRKLNSTTPPFM